MASVLLQLSTTRLDALLFISIISFTFSAITLFNLEKLEYKDYSTHLRINLSWWFMNEFFISIICIYLYYFFYLSDFYLLYMDYLFLNLLYIIFNAFDNYNREKCNSKIFKSWLNVLILISSFLLIVFESEEIRFSIFFYY